MKRIWTMSVRVTLWTLLVGSLTCAGALFAMYSYFADQALSAVQRRSESIAHSVDAAASILGETPQLVRMVHALGAEDGVVAIDLIERDSRRILASTDNSQIGTLSRVPALSEFDTLPAGSSAFSRTSRQGVAGNNHVVVLPMNIRDAGGTARPSLLVIRMDTSRIHAAAMRGMSEPALILICGTLLTLGAYIVMLHGSVLRPLSQMQRAVGRFAKGKLHARVPDLPRNEVGIFGEKLNRLLEGVTEARARVEQQNRELVTAKEEADRANRMKSDFLATMSHEIRTPLNGIMGMAQMLVISRLPAKQAQFARVILNSAETLLALINDILDLSKIEAGKITIESVTFSLHRLMGEVADLMAPRAREKNVEILLRIAPDVPDMVMGDPHRVRQVLLNLAGNAVKFTAKGHVGIGATLIQDGSDEGTRIRLEVRDTGIGIAPEVQPRLFAKFVQADSSTTRHFGGTGLGLAITRHLVTLMKGQVGLQSAVGEGSRFWVDLALPRDCAAPAAQGAPAIRDLPTGSRIMVIDETEIARDIARESIQHAGGSVVDAHDMAAARRLLSPVDDRRPDVDAVLLADNALAEARRLGLLKALATRKLPVVLWASQPETHEKDHMEGVSVAGVVPKPAFASRLVDALAAAVSAQRRAMLAAIPVTPASPAAIASAGTDRPQRFDGARVLVVDDNRSQQLLASKLLELLGCHVKTADDGQMAVEMQAGGRFDFIFMDCQMPGMNGLDATKMIRDIERERGWERVPIVAVTAHVMKGDRERCFKVGMDEHLSKPIHLEQMKQMLTRYLRLQPAADTTPPTAVPGSGTTEAAPFATVSKGTLFLGASILVIEDSEINCEVATAMLEIMGCRVTVAHRGATGIEACRTQAFDAILLDVQMPDMDGYETARELRRIEAETGAARRPIIALTANAQKGDRERCLAAGMDDYIEKPVDQGLLGRVLRNWLPTALHASGQPDPARAGAARDDDTINPAALLAVQNIMRGRFESYVKLFLRENGRQIEHLGTLVGRDGSPEEFIRSVHTLKSSSGQIGAVALSALAARIEDAAIDCAAKGQPIAPLASQVQELARLFADAERVLQKQLTPATDNKAVL